MTKILLCLLSLLATMALPCAAATFTVTNVNDSGAGSLREAMTLANGTPGATNLINFNISGTNVHTISPASALPQITGPVIIDGYTQTNSNPNTLANADNAVLLIELNGTNTSGNALSFGAGSSGSTVRGLVIDNWAAAIFIPQDDTIINVVIEGNFIGTDATGNIARGNAGGEAVALSNPFNRLGGTTPAARNIISGNHGGGVTVSSTGSGNNNLIQGNFIGVDATGTNALPNGGNGVRSFGSLEVIGGATVGARNIISGNAGHGILIGNGNANPPVHDILVQGNFIGTDATGTLLLPNGGDGVLVLDATGFTIGGATAVPGTPPGNLIAGNGLNGVEVSASQILVQRNLISNNAQNGVVINSSGNINNAVSANSIFGNGALGIDLGNNGATLNDVGDADAGANNLQNFPTLPTPSRAEATSRSPARSTAGRTPPSVWNSSAMLRATGAAMARVRFSSALPMSPRMRTGLIISQ